MTQQQNDLNMAECPRFISCDIPRCPLDIDSEKRVELKEDPKCKMWRYSLGRKPNGSIGHYVPRLRDKIVAIGELRGKII